MIVVGGLGMILGCAAFITHEDSASASHSSISPIEQKDVAYIEREGVDTKYTSLDIYHHEDTETLRPIVFYIHGGGWAIGDKAAAMYAKPRWAIRNGWALVSVNYRLSPDVMHPEHARDVSAAFAWVREHAEEFGGDPDQIAVMGHSAGAHLAAIIACNEDLLAEFGSTTDQIAGVVLLDGAGYNLPERMESLPKRGLATKMYTEAFGDNPELWESASPTLQAKPGDHLGAFLAIHAGDREESAAQSKALVKAWAATGVRAELHHAPDKTHMTLNHRLGYRGDRETKRIELFLESIFD